MRLRFIKNITVFFFIALALLLAYIQCIQSPRYTELSRNNRIRLIPLPAPRGNVYDRNGKVLATSTLAFDCSVIPQEFESDKDKMIKLSSLLGLGRERIEDVIEKGSGAPFMASVLKKDIGKESAIAISEAILDFPGLIISTYPVRYYPYGNTCSHVLGHLGKISGEEIGVLKNYGYKTVDLVGRGGIELYYNNYLRGEDGGRQTEVDARGRQLDVLGIREPERGRDITLTIDIELERYIDSLLEGHRGAVAVMESSSGEMLALVSKPDFDPNIFVAADGTGAIRSLMRRRDYPLVNRAISGAYPPGSVFKIVTATAALEMEKINKKERLDCAGFYMLGNRRFNCWKKSGHGTQEITDGIKNSCNVFFYQIGRRAGVDGISQYALTYGFGAATGMDLPYEAAGIVPDKAWKRRRKKESWYEGDTVNYAIGQGYLLVTPAQLLRMANAVGTEGELFVPSLVKKISDVDIFAPEKKHTGISEDTFKIIKEGMRKAVEERGGTASGARVDGMDIAGKTGTAETGIERKTHAWFAGFSPVEKPKISLVIFLEYGGKGGAHPCSMASDIFKKLRGIGYL